MDTKTTALLGGRSLEVTKLDGTRETIQVRQVPVRHFPALLEALSNEAVQAEFYTGRDPKWVDTLTPETIEAIIAEGERLNATFFQRWFDRVKGRMEKLVPGEFERLFGVQISRTGSAKSPSSAV